MNHLDSPSDSIFKENNAQLLNATLYNHVSIHDLNGIYLSVSVSEGELFGYESRELIGNNLIDFLHPTEKEWVSQELNQLIANRRDNTIIKCRIRRKNSTYVWFEMLVSLIKDEKGEPVQLCSFCKDVSTLINAEEEIAILKKLMANVLDNSSTGMLALKSIRDATGLIEDFECILVNKEAEKLMEKPLNFLLGKRLLTQIPLTSIKKLFDKFVQVVEEGVVYKSDQYFDDDNGLHCFQLQAFKHSNGLIITFSNISESKKIKTTLIETAFVQKHLLDDSNYLIISTDVKGVIQTFNPVAEKLLGYKAHEVVGKVTPIIFHEPQELLQIANYWTKKLGREIKPDFQLLVSQQELNELKREYTYITKTKSKFLMRFLLFPLKDIKGKVSGYIGIGSDVSKESEVEVKLKWKEALMLKMTESVPQAFYIVDHRTDAILYFNYQFTKIWHIEHLEDMMRRNELKSQDLLRHWNLLLRDFQSFVTIYQKLQKEIQRYTIEEELELINGRTINLFSTQIRDNSDTYYGRLYMFEDITERKSAEKKIKDSNDSLAEAQKIANIGNWEIDLHTQEVFWSVELYRIFDLQNLVNASSNFTHLVKQIHTEDVEIFLEAIEKTIQLGIPYNIDHRVVMHDGSVKHVHSIGNPVKAADGGIIAIKGVIHDVTQQKLIETQLVKAKELAEESVKVKEQFLANMSHEIRTPLNGIVGMAHLLSKTPLDQEQHKFIEAIKFSGDNLMVIINDILDLAKIEAGKMHIEETTLYVRQILKSVVNMFAICTEEKQIELLLEVEENVPEAVLGDTVRLYQVLLNLVGNAVKFTHQGFIKVYVGVEDESATVATLRFSVKDTGIGIPPDKLDFIFESFTQASIETTRRFGGTGLGLAICKKLLELQKGKLNAISELNKGSEFFFTIPYKKAPITPAEINKDTSKANLEVLPGKLSILLAEDNLINSLIVTTMLKKWKQVETVVDVAKDGREVLEFVKNNEYDLILMDCNMPEMDGYTATHIIRSEFSSPKKDTPIIAITASALQQDKEKVFACGMDDFIPKPFEQAQLFDKVLAVAKLKLKQEELKHTNSKAFTSQQPEPLFDLSFLHTIVGEDPEGLQPIVEKFVEKIPLEIAELEQALTSRNYKLVSAIAHKLKANVKFFGIEKLYGVIEDIEAIGKEGGKQLDRKALAQKVLLVKEVFTKVVENLTQSFKSF